MCHSRSWKTGFFLAALLPVAALATTWAPASTTVTVSYDTQTIVRITPGTNQTRGTPLMMPFPPENAHATYLRYDDQTGSYRPYQIVTLANGVAPAQTILGNDGVLVTLDNWGPYRDGAVVAIYSASGALVAAYGLGDLYPPDAVSQFVNRGPIGIVTWREYRYRTSIQNQEIRIPDLFGNVFVFDTTDGSFEYKGKNPMRFVE